MTKSKEQIARLAYPLMEQEGIAALTLCRLSQKTGLPMDVLQGLYMDGDDELRMDTVAYAGRRWVGAIEGRLRAEASPADCLARLTREYALGTSQHPAALTAYIDLWKYARDGNGYVRRRLGAIYTDYVQAFGVLARTYGAATADERTMTAVAHWMTALSDALHIQSNVAGLSIDFEALGDVLTQSVPRLLRGEDP